MGSWTTSKFVIPEIKYLKPDSNAVKSGEKTTQLARKSSADPLSCTTSLFSGWKCDKQQLSATGEQPLLGRPVFIREVRFMIILVPCSSMTDEKISYALVVISRVWCSKLNYLHGMGVRDISGTPFIK